MPCPRPFHTALILTVASGVALTFPAWAAETEACPERIPLRSLTPEKKGERADRAPTEIFARELRVLSENIGELTGDAEIQREGSSLRADEMHYDKSTQELHATGNVQFREASGLSFQTEETQINLETRIGHATSGTFRLGEDYARGDIERVNFEGPDHTRLKRVRYTTCAPGQDDWFLKVRELKLDTAEDIGTAYHASVHFFNVPLFYLPYLSFPISDERKSGFLIPRLGHSGKLGTEISAPYYFNLAPNYDDTLTPRYLSKRGWQLQNEFRYLTPRSEGTLNLEALPNDRGRNGDDRAAGTYLHKHVFNPFWSGNVDVRGVSDKTYIEDFGDNLGITSQTHLPQNAHVDYRGPLWNLSLRAADYQTIDPTIAPGDRPYARLPQINLGLALPSQPNRLNYYFETEAVNFDRSVGVTGGRLNLSPAMAWPLANSYGFVTPRLGLRHIAYALDGTTDESPSVTRGVFSLDSGLYFDRETNWGGRLFTQTLEPRLYYLKVPHKTQDALPNFDTGLTEFAFSSLFRDNRFSGGDRIGDAEQVTAAVTTRFIDETDGAERASASLGRIYYLEDRRVNLPAGVDRNHASDIAAEATATLTRDWHARSGMVWRPSDDLTQKYNLYLQYNPAKNRIINVGKRFSRNELEQTDISTEWPIAARWTFRARSLYSQREDRNVETFAGVEYNACCWALRIVAARRLIFDSTNSNAATQNNSIMIELELTGLSKLGKVPESPLRESVFSFPSRATEATLP